MLRSFRIGKLFGIPLYVHTTFFLLPAWVLLLNRGSGPGAWFTLTLLLAVFACVVLHELGHALMARVFGIGTDSITLYPIGGVARLRGMSEKPLEEICIALAGPAVNLVLAAGLFAAVLFTAVLLPTSLDLAAGQFLMTLCLSNVVLMVFNLIPCFPMDGGRVLRALLALGRSHLRATEIAARVSLVMVPLIAALSLLLHSPMPLILAAFVLWAGQRELLAVRQREMQRRTLALLDPFPQPEWAAVPVPPSGPEEVPFTGIAWDSRFRVWVRWHNGHPVAFWG